jgi:hypothetical protein
MVAAVEDLKMISDQSQLRLDLSGCQRKTADVQVDGADAIARCRRGAVREQRNIMRTKGKNIPASTARRKNASGGSAKRLTTVPIAPAPQTTQWRTLPAAGEGSSEYAGATSRAVDRAQEVGTQLQEAFGRLLGAFPPRVVKIADVARWLDLDRSICQRVVTGVRDSKDPLGVLERFPGVRGLEQFIAAAESKGCPRSLATNANDAVEQYAQLVNAAGGSQTRLVDRIGHLRATTITPNRSAPSEEEIVKLRRRAYESAVGITGANSSARVEVLMVGPSGKSRGNDGQVTTVSATGMIGLELAAHAMPITRKSRLAGLTPVPAASGGATPPASGLTPQLLLPQFSSQPAPLVTTRTSGEWLIQMFESDYATSMQPLDIVAGLAFGWQWGTPAPEEGDADFYSVGRIIGPPTRTLVFDLYLHRGLPAPKTVSAHVLRPSTQGSLGNARPQTRWYDRIPQEHDLVLLGGSPGTRGSDAYPRLGELTKHLVQSMQWESTEFAGYRLEVEFPLFDFEYVIFAEF